MPEINNIDKQFYLFLHSGKYLHRRIHFVRRPSFIKPFNGWSKLPLYVFFFIFICLFVLADPITTFFLSTPTFLVDCFWSRCWLFVVAVVLFFYLRFFLYAFSSMCYQHYYQFVFALWKRGWNNKHSYDIHIYRKKKG